MEAAAQRVVRPTRRRRAADWPARPAPRPPRAAPRSASCCPRSTRRPRSARIVDGDPPRPGRRAGPARRRARRPRLGLHRRAPPRSPRAAGARVVHRDDVLPDVPAVPGKGEALWRSLRGDHRRHRRLRRRRPAGLPLRLRHRAARPAAHRPVGRTSSRRSTTGRSPRARSSTRPAADASPSWSPGRCSTCTGRSSPASCSRWPASTPPAAACWSGCRSPPATASRSPCWSTRWTPSGSTPSRRSTSACGVHRHHDDLRLGRMAAEIWQTALARLHQDGDLQAYEPTLTQFVRDASHYLPVTHDVAALERPPLLSVVGDERLRGR